TSASATPLPAPANDVPVRRLVLLARASLGLAPRRGRMPSAGALTLAPSKRVVDRVHRNAPNRRSLGAPAVATRLAELHELVLRVAHLADGALAGGLDEPHLSRGQAQRREPSLLGDELHAGPRRPGHL